MLVNKTTRNLWHDFEVLTEGIIKCLVVLSIVIQLGKMSKRKADFDTPEKENKGPKTSGSGTLSARFFKDEWKIGNTWLRYDPKSKLMFCDYCIKSQRQNIFTKGCSVIKTKSVSKDISKGKVWKDVLVKKKKK